MHQFVYSVNLFYQRTIVWEVSRLRVGGQFDDVTKNSFFTLVSVQHTKKDFFIRTIEWERLWTSSSTRSYNFTYLTLHKQTSLFPRLCFPCLGFPCFSSELYRRPKIIQLKIYCSIRSTRAHLFQLLDFIYLIQSQIKIFLLSFWRDEV